MFKRLLDVIWQPESTPNVTDNTLVLVMIIAGSVMLAVAIGALVYYLVTRNKTKKK